MEKVDKTILSLANRSANGNNVIFSLCIMLLDPDLPIQRFSFILFLPELTKCLTYTLSRKRNKEAFLKEVFPLMTI